nr:hypothetical protein [Tanacetum cinerariifolium]
MTLTFAETHNMVAYLSKSDASEGSNQMIDFLNESSIKMGYEKPSTKLTFYKAFFSSQWKFLIHTILQCMSAKRTSWNEFSSSMASAIICCSSGDLSTHTTKYTSPALTQKVFANIRRVGKGFLGVKTPLFEGMLVVQEIVAKGDAEVHGEEVNAGDAAEGDVSATHEEVPTVAEEPSIPSPTPPAASSQPSHDIPSTSQTQLTPPQSPQVQPQSPQPQPQPQQDAKISTNLFQEVMDTCTTFSRRVKHLKLDKIAQALEITKLKRRVKNLERRNKVKVLKLRRLQKRVETSDETMLDDLSNQGRMVAEMDQDADVVLKDDKEDGKKVADDDKEEDETEPAKVQEVVDVITIAKLITEVVIAASETITAASAIITAAESQVPAAATAVTLTAAPARAELNKNINWDGAIDHVKKKAKEDPTVKRYQLLKRKPQTKAQARKNMMVYLKNIAGFKMDYFKGMSYDDILLIFEAKFNSNVAFLLKTKEQIEEDENRAPKRLNETPAKRAAKRRKLDEEQSQRMEAIGIMWCADHNIYIYSANFVGREENIDWDEAIDHVNNKAKEDNAVKRYQAMKRKPQTEAQARKNMMVYLKNVAGFKMDYFKGMSYDDIRPIFERYFDSNMAFLLKTKEQIEEEESKALKRINATPAEKTTKKQKLDEEVEELKRHLQIVPNEDDDVYTEATPLARKVPVVDYEIINMNNKPYYKIIRANGTHQLYVSFLTLLRNFDREDLEALWSLVKERFATIKPKNFFDDFLLVTLGAMFEKSDIHAQICFGVDATKEVKKNMLSV